MEWQRELKTKTFKHLEVDPPHCIKCGFKDVKALTIDHITGGGNKERAKLGHWRAIYQKILKMPSKEAREQYQVLCYNCNKIKVYENKEAYRSLKRLRV